MTGKKDRPVRQHFVEERTAKKVWICECPFKGGIRQPRKIINVQVDFVTINIAILCEQTLHMASCDSRFKRDRDDHHGNDRNGNPICPEPWHRLRICRKCGGV